MPVAPLTREEMKSIIEGRGKAYRIPMLYDFWVHPWTYEEREAEVRAIMAEYPMDACIVPIRMPSVFKAPDDDPGYRWLQKEDPGCDNKAIDEQVAISDEEFENIQEIVANFPSAAYANMYPEIPAEDGRYRLACWFFCLFERHWSLRGMSNALTDFYLYPDETHVLYSALTEFYIGLIERAHKEGNADGIFTSDDVGTQTGPFFSPEIFTTFFKPYYARIAQRCHELGMHFWMHTCGDVTAFLDDYIDLGLDVIHPIQKYTMDEKTVAQEKGGKICIYAGFDVQRIIPWGTPEEVRAEVRFLIDTYSREDGRFMLTAGNGVNQDCPIESLRALYDETLKYGIRAN